jgi:predicted nucleic acid-binding protein
MNGGVGRSFLDTNVLVYSFEVGGDTVKQGIARELVVRALNIHDAIISFQVVQEFLNVATRKSRVRMSPVEARYYIEHVLMPLCEVHPSESLYTEAVSIVDETGWSFYDSLIISSALDAGCTRVLTEDLQHGRKIHGVEIQNPFL